MVNVDLNLLRDRVDVETVCDRLNIPVIDRGGRTLVICPFHDDHDFGSAFIVNNSIKCYACGTHGDAFDIVMKKNGMTFSQACNFLAEMFGGLEMYTGKSVKISGGFSLLNKKEREALKIPNTSVSINNLADTDYSLFKKAVIKIAEHSIKEYTGMLQKYGRRDAPEALYFYKMLGGATKEDYAEFSAILKDRINTCEDVIRRFT